MNIRKRGPSVIRNVFSHPRVWNQRGVSASMRRGKVAKAPGRSVVGGVAVGVSPGHLCGLGCGHPRRLTRRCLGHRVPPAHRRVPPHCARLVRDALVSGELQCQLTPRDPRRFIPRECRASPFLPRSLSLPSHFSIYLREFSSILRGVL